MGLSLTPVCIMGMATVNLNELHRYRIDEHYVEIARKDQLKYGGNRMENHH